MSVPKKIEGLLESVSGSLDKLDELERTYNAARGNLTAELASYLDQLAAASAEANSQAVRAQIVRKLYWNEKISAELLGEAFKLKTHTLIKVAGPLVLSLRCPNGCGNTVNREFRSRLELKNYYGGDYTSRIPCDECQRKAEAEREAEEVAKRQRNLELQGLPWEHFTETEEWRELRNNVLHVSGYACDVCQAKGVGLFVYLGQDTPQNYPHFSRSEYLYHVLCGGCVSVCEHLINPKKGEYIKAEFVKIIRDVLHQGVYSEDAMYV